MKTGQFIRHLNFPPPDHEGLCRLTRPTGFLLFLPKVFLKNFDCPQTGSMLRGRFYGGDLYESRPARIRASQPAIGDFRFAEYTCPGGEEKSRALGTLGLIWFHVSSGKKTGYLDGVWAQPGRDIVFK